MTAFSPDDARELHMELIPKEILDIVNRLLAERVNSGGRIHISQQEVVDGLAESSITEREALDHGWFDFEDLYRKRGWQVSYDKPGFNESYSPGWDFKDNG